MGWLGAPQNGIATSTFPPVSVYKTYDGGYTWEPSIMWIDFYPSHECIEFYNEQIGYLVGGGRSASTIDGGENWTIHYHEQNQLIEQVAYIDSLKMVAVGSPNYGPDSTIRRIIRSTDGGANWTTVVEEITALRGFNYVVLLMRVCKSYRGREETKSGGVETKGLHGRWMLTPLILLRICVHRHQM
ncbi:MAG: hypothetical protein IPP40_14175 [bacterium]|nr:hypothetical protein [bacterium]